MEDFGFDDEAVRPIIIDLLLYPPVNTEFIEIYKDKSDNQKNNKLLLKIRDDEEEVMLMGLGHRIWDTEFGTR